MGFNIGNVLDTIEPHLDPDRPRLIHCREDGTDRILTSAQVTRRTNNLGRYLLDNGAAEGDKLAFYMRNSNAYMETLAAGFKSRQTHVNINYRYQSEELYYIIDNSDAATIVYDREFAPMMAELKPKMDKCKIFIEVSPDGKPATPVNDFAVDYETILGNGDGATLNIERSDDDLLFIVLSTTRRVRIESRKQSKTG